MSYTVRASAGARSRGCRTSTRISPGDGRGTMSRLKPPDRRRVRGRDMAGATKATKAKAGASKAATIRSDGDQVLDITGRPVTLRQIALDTFFMPRRVAVVG